MVKLALPLAAVAMMAVSVAAVPAATSGTTFSFAQWVEDIIAHPDTALSVDEAVAAAHAAEVVGSAAGLSKRATCNQEQIGWRRANGREAAACVDWLARKGLDGIDCGVPSDRNEVQMCASGNAEITASKLSLPNVQQSANCNDVARTAGKIFDSCWRSDDTLVGSEVCITNSRMQVNIRGL